MNNFEWEDELYHHGIFGQKWGKRNGPPYPLKPGKHSFREKRLGWRKSLKDNREADVPKQKKKDVDWDKHPDSKYFDSRKFGTEDLDRLTNRFNSEKAFNDALAAKLRSENMLDVDKYKSMSRQQKRELYQKITEMEADADYYNAYQRQVQSQVNLIESQKRLAELTKKPDTRMQKAKKEVGKLLVDMGKQSVKNVGTEAFTYLLGTGVNKIAGTQVVNTNKSKEDIALKNLNRQTEQLKAQYNYQKAQKDLSELQKPKSETEKNISEYERLVAEENLKRAQAGNWNRIGGKGGGNQGGQNNQGNQNNQGGGKKKKKKNKGGGNP